MYIKVIDKNKQKIFTGDIIECLDDISPAKGVVEFIDGGFALNCINEYVTDWIDNNSMKVIGNIFENPELLKAASYVG
jgi:uncharacterized phage protein (TIGR01671 family)